MFLSYSFPLLFGLLLIVYYRLPGKAQRGLLLGFSILCYARAGLESLGLMLLVTVLCWCAARAMERWGRKRGILLGCLTVNFALLALCRIRFPMGPMPVGISFYLLQCVGYCVDVYRGKVSAERNILKFALFASFFPQMAQGPIGRYDTLSRELSPRREYDRSEVSEGLMRMLWGYFKKLVVADRLAVPVATLKGSFGPGFLLLTVLYTVRLYADFTGGMDMALGAARALGIRLEENFDRPFSAKSVAEYWRRWHMTLGRWMKEYVFYPLCVSRPLLRLGRAARKRLGNRGKRVSVYIATGITWLATGLWHGAAPNFLLWGMLNCGVLLISQELEPLYARFHKRFGWKGKRWYARFEMARTFFLMNLIRACDLFPNPIDYVNQLASLVRWGTVPELGLGPADWWILALGTALMFGAEGHRENQSRLSPGMKWAGAAVLVLITLVFGCYGLGYDAGSFIYGNF